MRLAIVGTDPFLLVGGWEFALAVIIQGFLELGAHEGGGELDGFFLEFNGRGFFSLEEEDPGEGVQDGGVPAPGGIIGTAGNFFQKREVACAPFAGVAGDEFPSHLVLSMASPGRASLKAAATLAAAG